MNLEKVSPLHLLQEFIALSLYHFTIFYFRDFFANQQQQQQQQQPEQQQFQARQQQGFNQGQQQPQQQGDAPRRTRLKTKFF
jgi:hypothetical protein